MEIAEALVRSAAIDVLVVDSVAALVPRAEIEGEMGDTHVGLQARLMSQALRKLSGAISKSQTIAIFINQIREKVGRSWNPVTPRRSGFKIYETIRLEVRRVESLKIGNEIIGNRTRGRVLKNKVAPPFRTAQFDILYGKGISKEGALLDLGLEEKIISKSGAWYSYGEERLGQGRENARDYLIENKEVAAEIARRVREVYGLVEVAEEAKEEAPGEAK